MNNNEKKKRKKFDTWGETVQKVSNSLWKMLGVNAENHDKILLASVRFLDLLKNEPLLELVYQSST